MKKKILFSSLLCSMFALVLCGGILHEQSSYKPKEAKADTFYDLWIAGIQVTDTNKDNILPSGEDGQGTASFDPITNTLYLNDFNIVSQASGSTDPFGYENYLLNEIGIASKLNKLTIDITNQVSIGKQVSYEPEVTTIDDYDFKLGIISTKDISIVGSGKFFSFGGMNAAIAENLLIDMDFGEEANSELFFESLTHLDEEHSYDENGTVLVNKNFDLVNGYATINCFEENSIVSLEGDITIKDSQLDADAGHDCLLAVDGDLIIDNSYVGLTAQIAGAEILNRSSADKGNTVLSNNSFVYVMLDENTVMGISSNETMAIDNSRFYTIGFDAYNFAYAIATQAFEMKGNSLLYSNAYGYGAVAYEGPAKINITGGTVISNSLYGLYGGGESKNDFIVGSEATPFVVKNGGMMDEEKGEIVPITVCEGVVPTFDYGDMFITNIGPAEAEVNDGYVEINTYATVSMDDYEYGGTVSTPSIDHELAKLWGEEIETVTYLYYADGETIDDAEIWEDIEPDTLNPGTYNMVAWIVDGLFNYYSDPVEFEVTKSGPTLIAKPTKDTTVFTYNGQEQTYNVASNDAYTITGNKQTNAGNYTVTVALKDKSNYAWADGGTDDLEFDFVINKAAQVIEIDEFVKTYDNSQTYFPSSKFSYLGDGLVTIEYKLATQEDSEYTTNPPIESGYYTVRVSVAEGTNYLAGTKTRNFTIEPAKINKVGFGDITQPVAGEEAPTTVKGIAIGSRYAGTISWSPTLIYGDFDYNITYTATVTLEIVPSSANNYRFADDVTLVRPLQGWTKSDESTGTKLIYTKTFEKTGKIPQEVNITNDISKTYDGSSVSAPTYTKLGEGEVTIEYKLQSEEDIAYTTTAPKNVGDYVVRVSVNETDTHLSGYQTKEFSITKAKVAIPTADSSSFTYNGNNLTYNIAESDLYTISGNVAKDAGTHPVTVSLKDTTNYKWADGSVEDLTYDFTINKAKVNKPNADNTKFVYTGDVLTYNIAPSDLYNVGGNHAGSVGEYNVSVSLIDTDNYEWADGNSDPLTYNFIINKAKVTKPNADTSKFTYNGENQTYNITLNNAYTVSGNVAKDAGTHPVTVSLKDTANYEWVDGTTNNLTFDFVIGEAPASDSCFIHWFALSVLIVGLLLVSFLGFVFKKYLAGTIISIICLIAGIVLLVIGKCSLCTGFGISNVVVFAVMTVISIILFFMNNKDTNINEDIVKNEEDSNDESISDNKIEESLVTTKTAKVKTNNKKVPSSNSSSRKAKTLENVSLPKPKALKIKASRNKSNKRK